MAEKRKDSKGVSKKTQKNRGKSRLKRPWMASTSQFPHGMLSSCLGLP